MTAPNIEPISEQCVKVLLEKVKSLRLEWARFAVQSDGVFRAFREKGDSLPELFLNSCRILDDKKAALSQEIAHTVIGLDPELWQAPSPKDSLHDFEHKLDDLIQVTRELTRVIAEKRDRYLGVLRAVQTLESDDVGIETLLAALRCEADRDTSALIACASRLADIALENRVQSLISLLDLSKDARNRLWGTQVQTKVRSSAECQSKFELVSAKFGLQIAIEALRTGLAKTSLTNANAKHTTYTEIDTAVLSAPTSPASQSAKTTSPAANTNAIASELNDRPTKAALESLIHNFGHNPTLLAGSRRQVSSSRVVASSSVSLSSLADAGKSLKIKAHSLHPNALDCGQTNTHPSETMNCAIGLACLSEMIEVVGYVFAKGERKKDCSSKMLREILQLFAEVQNVVRVDAEQSGTPPLTEQDTSYKWLRDTCSKNEEAIHIDRYMRFDDRADPSNNAELARRVFRLRKQTLSLQDAEKGLVHLKHLCQQLVPSDSATSLEMDLPLWSQVNNCVSHLVRDGLKPSDTRIRDTLLPIIEYFPEPISDKFGDVSSQCFEISNEFQQVIKSIHEHMEKHTLSFQETIETDSEAVIKVSNLLQNKILVIVGGICEQRAAERLKQKLKVREVRWLEATKQDRVSEFRSSLRGAEVVVLLTRLIGHKHNDIREMCREAGIPWVQMPISAGYHPNTVASAILRQASEQLQTA